MSTHLKPEELIERARVAAVNQDLRERYHALKMARICSFLLFGERHEFRIVNWETFAAFVVNSVFRVSGLVVEPPEHEHDLDQVPEREYYRSGLLADALSDVLLADAKTWRTLTRARVRIHREDVARLLATNLGVDIPILDHQQDPDEPNPAPAPAPADTSAPAPDPQHDLTRIPDEFFQVFEILRHLPNHVQSRILLGNAALLEISLN